MSTRGQNVGMEKVAVIGSGSWGSTVAGLCARRTATTVWVRPEEGDVADEINANRTNHAYLPGVTFPEGLRATTSVQEAVLDADLVVMAVPSQWFRTVMEVVALAAPTEVPIVSLVKGLEEHSYLRMTQVVAEVAPGHPVGALSGPNIATEVAAGITAATVLSMEDPKLALAVRDIFNSPRFRVYMNHDIPGVELGGALKNVIAIAAGLSDGCGGGDNTRAAIVTRGLAELTRLGVAMGGKAETFAGLAGLGDLVVTCTSKRSRNRTVGEKLAGGVTIDEITNEMAMVAEGVKTSETVVALAGIYDVPMPISVQVHNVITRRASTVDAWRAIVTEEPGMEAEPG